MADLDIDPALFQQVMDARGERAEFRLFKRRLCYCTNPDTMAHDPTHSACGGTGFLEAEQTLTNKALWVQDVGPNHQYVRQGVLNVGDIVVQFMPGDLELEENDFIVLTNSGREFKDEQPVMRGTTAGGLDALRRPYVTRLGTIQDAVRTYVATTDFVLTADSVSWSPGGNEPAAGAIYTVEFYASPTYKVLGANARRRRAVGSVKLPQSVPMVWRERDRFRS